MEMEEKAKLEKKQKALKEIELEIEQLVDASEKNVSEQMAAQAEKERVNKEVDGMKDEFNKVRERLAEVEERIRQEQETMNSMQKQRQELKESVGRFKKEIKDNRTAFKDAQKEYGDVYGLLKELEDPEAESFALAEEVPDSQRSHVAQENLSLEGIMRGLKIDRNFSDDEIAVLVQEKPLLSAQLSALKKFVDEASPNIPVL